MPSRQAPPPQKKPSAAMKRSSSPDRPGGSRSRSRRGRPRCLFCLLFSFVLGKGGSFQQKTLTFPPKSSTSGLDFVWARIITGQGFREINVQAMSCFFLPVWHALSLAGSPYPISTIKASGAEWDGCLEGSCHQDLRHILRLMLVPDCKSEETI